MTEARRQFDLAIEAEPRFTEAWYNRGATKARLAIEAIRRGDESGAVAIFRESVMDKKRAQELVDQNVWFVYQPGPEQDQVRHDLKRALEDADAVLADEPSLIRALKLWAAVQ